jgi:hypothetical protein
MESSRRAMVSLCSLAVMAGLPTFAHAQAGNSSQTALTRSTATVRSTGIPQRDTLLALMRPIVVKFQDQRLEDVLGFIRETTGAEMEVMWQDDQNPVGLDKEIKINLNSNGLTALALIERVLQKADATSGSLGASASQWQMADSGEIQIGPKSRLNAFKRVEIYDISDLLVELPNFTDAPTFDLQSVLQSSEGGGGGQSPFQSQGTQNQGLTTKSLEQRLDEVVTLVTRLVEPEQWENSGGDGGTIQPYGKALIVNAPDYMHRELNGYSYWPDTANASAGGQVRDRRWVQLNGSFESSELEGFGTSPVFVPGPR